MNFGFSFKNGNDIIAKKSFDNIELAYKYFAKIKQMSLNDFKKIFVVVQL